MESNRLDALARLAAASGTRRQLVRGLVGGLLIPFGDWSRWFQRACPSGVVCAAQCCPNAGDICLAGRCASCPSGIICAAQCCAEGETCRSGRCQAAESSPGPAPCTPTCTSTSSCLDSDGCGGICGCPSGQICICTGQCGSIDEAPIQCG